MKISRGAQSPASNAIEHRRMETSCGAKGARCSSSSLDRKDVGPISKQAGLSSQCLAAAATLRIHAEWSGH